MAPTSVRSREFDAMSWAPYIHPSGQYIVFSSNKLGFENFEVFMVDIEGRKEPIRVTYSDGFDGLPVPSPDGRQLAWTSSRSGGREGQIFLAQWNHEQALDALSDCTEPKAATMKPRLLVTILAGLLIALRIRHPAGATYQGVAAAARRISTGHMSSGWRPSSSGAARPDPRGNDWPRSISQRNSRGWGPAGTWTANDVRAVRVHRGQPRRWLACDDRGRWLQFARYSRTFAATASPGPRVFGQCAGHWSCGIRRVWARGARVAELRLRQLCRPGREGQSRRGASLFSRGRGTRRRARSWPATPTCGSRRWRRASAARRRCSS